MIHFYYISKDYGSYGDYDNMIFWSHLKLSREQVVEKVRAYVERLNKLKSNRTMSPEEEAAINVARWTFQTDGFDDFHPLQFTEMIEIDAEEDPNNEFGRKMRHSQTGFVSKYQLGGTEVLSDDCVKEQIKEEFVGEYLDL